MSELAGSRPGVRSRVPPAPDPDRVDPAPVDRASERGDRDGSDSNDATTLANAIIAERRRLSRELHDGPVQSLWFLGAEIRRLRTRTAKGTDQLDADLVALQATWAEVYDELRQVMGDLHQPLASDNALVRTLERSLAGLERQTGIATELYTELEAADGRLDPTSQAQLIRISQAALVNVKRHAHARHVRVNLRTNRDGTLLSIEDDGVGFDPGQVCQRPTEHYGVTIMRERAESLGGRIDVISAPGQGTCLQVWVPAHPA